MNASMWPIVGRKMSPRGSFGLGSSANLRSYPCDRDVLAEEVDRVAEPLDRLLRVLRRVRLDALASAPEHVRLGAELHAEVDRAHGLLQRVRADARVVARERAVAKDRIAEQVRRRHRHLHARVVERRLELAHDPIALGRRRVARHEIVVVQVHAIRAELARAFRRCESARSTGRTGSPNGSRPTLPTVHRPKVKWCSGRGV